MLNPAMDAPARGPERFVPFADRMAGEPAGAGADAVTTPMTRLEALPC
ncbi:hypothetical protein OIE75_22545 [Streptomyces sp. NBC_01723]|nr:hypothetical protein [Streptomyces sp. NBC_01723]